MWRKRKEVRRNEEAHSVAGDGGHDGADDVVLWGGVRQDHAREPGRQPAGGEARGIPAKNPAGKCPAGQNKDASPGAQKKCER